MAFGTFDFFHAGHEFYLKKAKELGEYLVVIVSRDKTIKQIKGSPAVHNERQRLANLKKTGLADKVMLGNHGDKHKVILKYRPSVIALGYDQFVFTQKLKKTFIDQKMDTVIKRLDAYYPQVYKSSLIRTHVAEQNTFDTSDIPTQ